MGFCPHCNRSYPAGTLFCPVHGVSLQGAAVPPPQPLRPVSASPGQGYIVWAVIAAIVCAVLGVVGLSYGLAIWSRAQRQTPVAASRQESPADPGVAQPAEKPDAGTPADSSQNETPIVIPPTPDNTARPVDGADSELLTWVQNSLAAAEGPSTDALRPFYADSVSPYYSFSTADWSAIERDKSAYFDRFPIIRYELAEWSHAPQDDGSEFLELKVRYTVTRKDGHIGTGVSSLWEHVEKTDGAWKIVGVRESKN